MSFTLKLGEDFTGADEQQARGRPKRKTVAKPSGKASRKTKAPKRKPKAAAKRRAVGKRANTPARATAGRKKITRKRAPAKKAPAKRRAAAKKKATPRRKRPAAKRQQKAKPKPQANDASDDEMLHDDGRGSRLQRSEQYSGTIPSLMESARTRSNERSHPTCISPSSGHSSRRDELRRRWRHQRRSHDGSRQRSSDFSRSTLRPSSLRCCDNKAKGVGGPRDKRRPMTEREVYAERNQYKGSYNCRKKGTAPIEPRTDTSKPCDRHPKVCKESPGSETPSPSEISTSTSEYQSSDNNISSAMKEGDARLTARDCCVCPDDKECGQTGKAPGRAGQTARPGQAAGRGGGRGQGRKQPQQQKAASNKKPCPYGYEAKPPGVEKGGPPPPKPLPRTTDKCALQRQNRGVCQQRPESSGSSPCSCGPCDSDCDDSQVAKDPENALDIPECLAYRLKICDRKRPCKYLHKPTIRPLRKNITRATARLIKPRSHRIYCLW